MMQLPTALLLSLLLTSGAIGHSIDTYPQNCVKGVHVIAARQSDFEYHDPYNTNPDYKNLSDIQPYADAIIKKVGKGSFLSPVPYPATLANIEESLGRGIDATQAMIKSYVDGCGGKREPRIVLASFSQGAAVISTAITGGLGRSRLEKKYERHIKAAVFVSDPGWVVGVKPLNVGNARKNGVLPKSVEDLEYLNSRAHKYRSYCEEGDSVCASGTGADADIIHFRAPNLFAKATIKFVLDKV